MTSDKEREIKLSKAKMIAARELIKEKKYNEARMILESIDHPTAREWLSKLDQISPKIGRQADYQRTILIFGGAALIAFVIISVIYITFMISNNIKPTEIEVASSNEDVAPSQTTIMVGGESISMNRSIQLICGLQLAELVGEQVALADCVESVPYTLSTYEDAFNLCWSEAIDWGWERYLSCLITRLC